MDSPARGSAPSAIRRLRARAPCRLRSERLGQAGARGVKPARHDHDACVGRWILRLAEAPPQPFGAFAQELRVASDLNGSARPALAASSRRATIMMRA